jgi:hypothetical protein
MMRTLPFCAVLLTVPLVGRAAEAPVPTETVIRMAVRPMGAPKPALKYQLLPELREMNPGNPIQGYLRSFMEQGHFYYNKEEVDKREKWLTMPLNDLPLLELRKYSTNSGLRQADYAARLDAPDWQYLLKLKSDGTNLLLPDVQKMRSLAGALKVRFRVEVAERRFDDALVTAKTMFALSRHLGENPTTIGDLVGIAIAFVAIGPLDEMIQQSGCPNLFWALTELPTPFIDLRKGMQGERVMAETEFASLNDRAPMTEVLLRKILKRGLLMPQTPKDRERLTKATAMCAKRATDADYLRVARQRLIESGLAADEIEKLPGLQVVLLDEKRAFVMRREEGMKAMTLPYWQAHTVFAAIPPPKEDETLLFNWLLSRYDRVKMAQARLDQRLGLLRCVEALRLYAAEHDGKLPARLDDIKLPLPIDPINGKPFIYKLDGATAILHGTPPPGQEKVAAYNIRYEVTIVK